MVIWVTGLSAAGKTTLCCALQELVKPRVPEFVNIDGDVVRAAFGGDLGYGEAERVIQIRRIQGLARVLALQGLVVAVGALYARPDLLAWNRENLPGYFEVYLEAPMELLLARDPKGLYAKSEAGEMTDVVGVDIPWHVPESPDMVIDAGRQEPPAIMAERVARAVPRLARALPTVMA